MAYQLSMSSIENSGIPLLPPLITNDITIEIQYYKQLAIAVEERLKALEIAKEAASCKNKNELDKNNVEVPTEKHDSSTDLLFVSESRNVSVVQDMISIPATEMDHPTKDKDDENLIDIDFNISDTNKVQNLMDKDISISEPQQKSLDQVGKLIPDEDKSCLNGTLLGDSVSSDTVTASTDLNQYLNTSASIRTDTTDTTPENWKPQVPKTLDIVPITVDQSKPGDKSSSADEETPKLVRRGSYVLDTPSPMLLAHMQGELPTGDYTPTSSAQLVKRKEWNISQVKADWETHNNLKEPTTSRTNTINKFRKENPSRIPSHRVCKSVSNSKTGSPLDVYQPAKSVDCIQAMFAKECYSPKTAGSTANNQNQRYVSPVNGTNGIRIGSSKKLNKSTSILSLANKMSGSLGSLSNISPKPVRRVERKNSNETNLDKSFDSVKSNDSSSLSKKQKPVITSEKIVTIFREIQETHKKQMIELMTRQQKEQMLMQENFKKQQILLLAQIRKAFPEISLSALSEAISHKNAEHPTPVNSKMSNERSDSVQKMKQSEKPQMNGISCHEKNQQTIAKSPMDYTHPSKELSSTSCHLTIQPTTPTVATYYQNSSQSNQPFDDSAMMIGRAQLSNVRDIDDIPVGVPVRRHSSVSRQLFPLDSKTTHVPVLDNSVYTEKHTKAATIINAYAKGFLVRRLMKTEKIIALKNTYREALHCMLRLHVDAPLNLPELNFHQRLQLQCDAASMNIVDLFSQSPTKRMEIIAHDREIKKARSDRPSSARSYSFATQRTLARKKLKEMGVYSSMQSSMMSKSCPARTRCQTWTSNSKERIKTTTSLINQGIKRSTSAGAVRKPWR
ncbi:uncharacterized protein LOC100679756 [Nasonia vitripennis]|uniref:Centriolar coiled-coil protein of 110 kDa n=1 Tax=Nasonia vitripennis TaxID=7425 RepID=A0A7M7HDW7_NASVI|nr:uncharacterized protein LOC100679756 [Nasonia vitripennis]XP_008212766.1 uncharacterized protein LOC100679756 [Nasonia vitripennis]XP_016837504.1 uncharacterized protein LOC100679756 [Nasonia vitripennis]